jgi:hypothetical protein
MSKVLVGVIGVDAGLCWIGDPCYVFHRQPQELGSNWSEFCTKLFGKPGESHWQFNYDGGGAGLGVAVSTGYGDGEYPVYAEMDGDLVKRVWVEFVSDEEEEL